MPNPRYQEGSVQRRAIPGPVPQVEVKFAVEFSGINPSLGFGLTYWHPEVTLADVPIQTVGVSAPNVVLADGQQSAYAEFCCRLLLYPHVIQAIEAARKGDVKGSIGAWFHYVELIVRPPGGDTVSRVMVTANAPSVPLNFSRDEWAQLLDELQYDGSWIVEIGAPSLTSPGWERVREHLEEARRELRGNHPSAAAQKCRDAWEEASPFLVGRWEDAKAVMARGSKGLTKYTIKPERVATTYDDVSNLLNDSRFLADMAKHGAEHTISDDDALLIYRLSHALLAYLSRVSRER